MLKNIKKILVADQIAYEGVKRLQANPDLSVDVQIGLSLTDKFAMEPAVAVSGWYFSQPRSGYLNIGKIQQDQMGDYAER